MDLPAKCNIFSATSSNDGSPLITWMNSKRFSGSARIFLSNSDSKTKLFCRREVGKVMILSSVPWEMSEQEYSWAANSSGPLTRSASLAKFLVNADISFLPSANAFDSLRKCLAFLLLCLEYFRNFLELHSISDELSFDETMFSSVLASLSEPVSEDASDELEEGECLRFLLRGSPLPLLDFLCLCSLSDKER